MIDRRHASVVIAFALVSMTGFVACSDDDLVVATTDVVGQWSGSTSQQRDVDFTVTSAGVSAGDFGYQMNGTCTFTTSQQLISPQAMPISGGRFSTGKTQVGTGVFLTIEGEFTSSTTAKGTFLIQHAPCQDTLSLTWTASKSEDEN